MPILLSLKNVDITFGKGDNKVEAVKNASFDTEFKLTSYSYNNKYDYDCNSNTVISTIQGKEDELFKRIFVKINDCPKWSQQLLYQIRQKQLKDELKKEKKLELKRKFFPWIKK